MSAISRIEDIKAWQEARVLATSVYRITNTGAWAKDFGLRDQVRRAGVSIASNIAEGYARETDAEFARFLSIARGSANEVKTQLYIALDINYIDRKDFDEIYRQLDKICSMITNLMNYLRSGKSQVPTADRRPPTPDKEVRC